MSKKLGVIVGSFREGSLFDENGKLVGESRNFAKSYVDAFVAYLG